MAGEMRRGGQRRLHLRPGQQRPQVAAIGRGLGRETRQRGEAVRQGVRRAGPRRGIGGNRRRRPPPHRHASLDPRRDMRQPQRQPPHPRPQHHQHRPPSRIPRHAHGNDPAQLVGNGTKAARQRGGGVEDGGHGTGVSSGGATWASFPFLVNGRPSDGALEFWIAEAFNGRTLRLASKAGASPESAGARTASLVSVALFDHRFPGYTLLQPLPPEGCDVIDLNYPTLLNAFPQHCDPKRSESAAFLIWYLENYYRLDTLEAVDSVCDQRGDKGVDGIFVNDGDETITIFQSRISQRSDRTVGDTALKEFNGTLAQFRDKAAISQLLSTASNTDVATLIKNLDLLNKVETHDIVGEYVTNIDLDQNGRDYLAHAPAISFVGKSELIANWISDTRDIPQRAPVSFDIHGFQATEYIVDAGTKAVIAPIKATQLVTLDGISDQSIFTYNVRGPLGRTQVNKDIVKSIETASRHKLFPLFHNGITIVAKDVEATPDHIRASDYFVVNGCQSLTTLHSNRSKITDDLRILVKFIQIDPGSTLAEMVTQFSNNQNGVRPRDFKANNPIQIRLQNEFSANYSGQYYYEIKRGETPGQGILISNEDAGLWLRAFDLKEPWITHRKFEVFEDKHADLFGRPEVNADRIVLLHVILTAIDVVIPRINNALFGKYALTRYLLLYVVRLILETDKILFAELNGDPEHFVRDASIRAQFQSCLATILNDVVIDLNSEIDQQGENFYYRDRLRDSKWVTDLARRVVADYDKLVTRGRISSFSQEWHKVRGGAG
jgi:hypothetical protein